MVIRSLLWLTVISTGGSVVMAMPDSIQALQPQPVQSMVGPAAAGQVDNALWHVVRLVAEHSSSAQPAATAAIKPAGENTHAAAEVKHAAAEAVHAAALAAAGATAGATAAVKPAGKDTHAAAEVKHAAAEAVHAAALAAASATAAIKPAGEDKHAAAEVKHAAAEAVHAAALAAAVATAAIEPAGEDKHAAAEVKHAAAEVVHAAALAAADAADATNEHQPGDSMLGRAAAAKIDSTFRQVTGVGAEHSSPAAAPATITPDAHAAADAAAATNQHQPGDSMLGRAAAAKIDSTFRQVIGHSSPAQPVAAAAVTPNAYAAADAAATNQTPQPGQSMVGRAAAGRIDSAFRQVIGTEHSSSAQPAAAPAALAAADADAASQQHQPGDSMVGRAAAGKIDNVLRQVIGVIAQHNSSVSVGTPAHNASSGAEHTINEKKDSFRELAPTAAKADHIYKVAAAARSRSRAATGSDESVCPTDHLAAAVNAARLNTREQAQALSAEVYIFWLVVLCGGVVIAFLGEMLLKPSLFFVGLFGGFFGMMVLLKLIMQQGVDFGDTYCWLPPAISLGAGVVAGLFALWLLSTAIFLLGAIVGLAGSYFLLNLIPLNWAVVGMGPVLLEQRLMPYWLVLVVVPLITGYIAKKKEAPLILAATAVVGGLAVGLAARGLLLTAGIHTSKVGVAIIAGAFALGGGAVQWFVMHPFAALHRKRCGCGKKEAEAEADPKLDLRRA